MHIRDKRVLVLGCNSFSGSVCSRFLRQQGLQVFGVTRSKYLASPYNADFDRKEDSVFVLGENFNPNEIVDICDSRQITHIVNFVAESMVAQSWIQPEKWYETNVKWISRLTTALNSWGKLEKFLQYTTPEVYGSKNEWQPESWNFSPSTPYAISRSAGDWHLYSMGKEFNFPVVFTRTANIYGPHQPLYRVVPKALMMAKRRERFPLEGEGNSYRSFILMEDVARAVFLVLLNGENLGTYHISTQSTITTLELLVKIYDLYGLDFRDYVSRLPERMGKDAAYMLNSKKIRNEIGWRDEITLDNGLELTKRWIDHEFSALRNLPLSF